MDSDSGFAISQLVLEKSHCPHFTALNFGVLILQKKKKNTHPQAGLVLSPNVVILLKQYLTYSKY